MSRSIRSQVDELRAQGNEGLARSLLRKRVIGGAPYHEYAWLAQSLGELAPDSAPFRLAVLNTYTLSPLGDVLSAVGLAQGIRMQNFFGGYQQIEQELLGPTSDLRRFDPQGIVIAWLLEDLSPLLALRHLEISQDEMETELDRVRARIRELATICHESYPTARMVFHSLVPPPYSSLGILDRASRRGIGVNVDILNQEMARLAQESSSIWVLDCLSVARRSGPAWMQPGHWFQAHAPHGPAALLELALEYVRFVRAFAGGTKKVVVVDLDNTLWGGILGEVGSLGIACGQDYPGSAYRAFQIELKQLAHRGVLLAINSKNNEADVRKAFAKNDQLVLRWEDFAAWRINWQDKALNMRELAADISVALDTFVFVDDSSHEVALIEQAIPEIMTLQVPSEPAELPGLLSRLGPFDGLSYTAEDGQRTKLYRAEARRAETRREAVDLGSFYRSLDMSLTPVKVDGETDPAVLDRIAQLVQRTNQFNLTSRRHSRRELASFSSSSQWDVWGFRLWDRFGDSGLVAATVLDRANPEAWRIDTFVMSCRVIGRTVESAILAWVVQDAASQGAREVDGEFIPTQRNEVASELYPLHGFSLIEKQEQGAFWRLRLEDRVVAFPKWVRIKQDDR